MKRPGNRQNLREERRAKRRQEFRQAIIQAAERVMARKGYSALTMDDVAREAQFSKATIYHYFPGKGDLILELFLDYFDKFYQNMIKVKSREGGAKEKLRAIIHYFLHFHREKESLSRVLMLDKAFLQKMRLLVRGEVGRSSRRKPDLLAELKSRRELILREASGILSRGIERGEFRPMDPDQAIRLIESLLQGFIHSQFWNASRLSLEKETDLILDFILQGLGYKTESEKGA